MANTYAKLRAQLDNIEKAINEFKHQKDRYMKNGITGHEWEYIDMTKDLIDTIEQIIKQ